MAKKSDSKESKPKYFSFIVISLIAIPISIFILLKIFNLFSVTERMLFWFFAASSQSMAAMFAVVGVFAVFRFQAQENKLRNLYELFKNWIGLRQSQLYPLQDRKKWDVFIMENDRNLLVETGWDTTLWKDESVLEMGKGILNAIQSSNINKGVVRALKERIVEIEYQEKSRNNIQESMKIPMLAILVSFMLSTISLVLTVKISCSIAGFVIVMVMLAMIAFSVISVYKYINFVIILGRA